MEPSIRRDSTPIWMAALMAAGCLASRGKEDAPVRWVNVAGKALYTNRSAVPELILPLGVILRNGETVAVSWLPDDTKYTVEVWRIEKAQPQTRLEAPNAFLPAAGFMGEAPQTAS